MKDKQSSSFVFGLRGFMITVIAMCFSLPVIAEYLVGNIRCDKLESIGMTNSDSRPSATDIPRWHHLVCEYSLLGQRYEHIVALRQEVERTNRSPTGTLQYVIDREFGECNSVGCMDEKSSVVEQLLRASAAEAALAPSKTDRASVVPPSEEVPVTVAAQAVRQEHGPAAETLPSNAPVKSDEKSHLHLYLGAFCLAIGLWQVFRRGILAHLIFVVTASVAISLLADASWGFSFLGALVGTIGKLIYIRHRIRKITEEFIRIYSEAEDFETVEPLIDSTKKIEAVLGTDIEDFDLTCLSRLVAKHKNAQTIYLILQHEIWEGQTAEQLRSSLGEPEEIKEKEMATRVREVWCYDRFRANAFKTKITLDNDVVVRWEKN